MNFDFTIRAHGFEKAAALEAALKKLGIPYEVTQSKSAVERKTKVRRPKMDKIKVAAVVTSISKHPDWTDEMIGRETGISRNTVNRIRRGLHPLQKKDKKLRVAA